MVMTGTQVDEQWWNVTTRSQDPHKLVFSLFEQIKLRTETLRINTQRLICVYQWGYRSGEKSNPEVEASFNDDVLGANCAQNTIDTVHAKLCATRVVPMPLTVGGNYLARKRARDVGKALDGEWEENDIERIKQEVILDALITSHGAGAAKIFPKGRGKRQCVCVQQVPIDDLFFDPAEVRYRNPRSLIQRQRMDRFVALHTFGKDDPDLFGTAAERRAAILAAPEAINDAGEQVEAHQIEVVEMWHLPSNDGEEYDEGEGDDDDDDDGPKSKREGDGRHFIGIADCTFVDEPWDEPSFPVKLFVPRRRVRHVLGLSLMWNLAAPQREYEHVTYRIQKSVKRMGGTHIYLRKGSDVSAREIDNGQGTIIEGNDPDPPKEFNPTPVNPQTFEYRESIARDMNEKNGVSAMSTSNQVPAGLSQASGKALQVFEDAEDRRLLLYHREIERWVQEIAWAIIECARGIAERNPDYKTRYRGKGGIEPIKWADVLMDRNEFVLQMPVASALSKQPSAKYEQLTELLNAGGISIEQFKREFGLPDIDAELDLDTADTDVIDMVLDKIITTGKYISPEPWDDFALGKKRTAKFINLCRIRDVPGRIMDHLHHFWEDLDAMEKEAMAKAAAAAAPVGSGPGAGMVGPPPSPPGPPAGTPGAPDLPGIGPMPDQPIAA
jgi:hypothetical protein